MIFDTIVAIATAPSNSAISIVRVSGREAKKIASLLCHKEITPRIATLSNLYDRDNNLIDEAIVIYFKAPRSFTGEDIVEFQCHGGVVVSNLILKRVIELGARVAEPGEFTKRAFLNGKIDLTKAEAIAKLIETKSEDGAKLLARQLKGELKEFIEEIRDNLIEILAFIEVNIDYAEEDLPEDLIEQIEDKLKNISLKLSNSLQASKQREGLIEGFKISIIGKPNVGKSSLLNSLLNYNRAIVSSIAGTTRDTIEESIKIGTHLIKIIDTAGIREASNEIEKIGIERSVEAVEESEVVLALFDNSNRFDKEDEKILNLIEKYQKDKKIIVLLNKIDLEEKFDIKKIEKFNPIKISAKKSLDIVIERLKEILDKQTLTEDMILISTRQVEAVERANREIKGAVDLLKEGELELFAFNINEAINYISSITKLFERDEILEKMFSTFCVGK